MVYGQGWCIGSWVRVIDSFSLGLHHLDAWLRLAKKFFYLRQQQIATYLICDNEGLVKYIKKYYDFDMKHITPDMMEADIILPMIHFSKQLNYNLEWHRGHIER